jgi:hypothetical protein
LQYFHILFHVWNLHFYLKRSPKIEIYFLASLHFKAQSTIRPNLIRPKNFRPKTTLPLCRVCEDDKRNPILLISVQSWKCQCVSRIGSNQKASYCLCSWKFDSSTDKKEQLSDLWATTKRRKQGDKRPRKLGTFYAKFMLQFSISDGSRKHVVKSNISTFLIRLEICNLKMIFRLSARGTFPTAADKRQKSQLRILAHTHNTLYWKSFPHFYVSTRCLWCP